MQGGQIDLGNFLQRPLVLAAAQAGQQFDHTGDELGADGICLGRTTRHWISVTKTEDGRD